MKVKLVISDFDNTLYDWFAMWHSSFSFLLDAIVTEIPNHSLHGPSLMRAIRTVHQKYGTSEYAKLLDEIPGLWDNYTAKEKDTIINAIMSSYAAFKSRHTVLYHGVIEAILELKNKGVKFVVYTESQPLYSEDRLVELGLDGVVDAMYAPETQGNFDLDIDFLPKKKCQKTIVKTLPKYDKKPNPQVLLDIISGFDIDKSEVIYIGDSTMKDICMANHASVTSVLAQYGIVSHTSDYNLLRDVSHWPDSDVSKESIVTKEDCSPDHTINNFSEILTLFNL
jgi:phosphoglycolate phosphatase-like HAD superfamily hydrolase